LATNTYYVILFDFLVNLPFEISNHLGDGSSLENFLHSLLCIFGIGSANMTTDDTARYRLLAHEEAGRASKEVWGSEDIVVRPRGSSVLLRKPAINFLLSIFLFLLFGTIFIVKLGFCSSPKTPPSRPLNILISSTDAGIGELDYWVHNVLSRLGRPVNIQVMGHNRLEIMDDSIVVGMYDLPRWTELKLKSGFSNVGLFRIGDEKGEDSTYMHYAYTLRPYWFDRFNRSETHGPVVWVPNGYSAGVGPRLPETLLPFNERSQLCYFEGSGRDNGSPSSRENMRQALLAWDPTQKTCTTSWTSGFMQGLPPLDYSAHLGRSKYALCPAGDSPETIRFYEALENNAIPIVVHEPWMVGAFRNTTELPFVVLKSWNEVGPRLEELAAEDPAIGRARQLASRKWWEALQERVVTEAAREVNTSFANKYATR
jgi:hypothetical protein